MSGLSVPAQPWIAIVIIHYAYPLLNLLYFAVASMVSICTLQTHSLKVRDQHVRRDIIIWLKFGVICEYVGQASLVLARTFSQENWFASQDEIVYLISSVIVWGIQTLALADSQFPVWYPYYVNWAITICAEITLLVVLNVFSAPVDVFDFVSISIQILRVGNLILLPFVYVAFRNRSENYDNDDAERQSLLRKKLAVKPSSSEESTQTTSGYGAVASSSEQNSSAKNDEEEDDFLKSRREAEERVARRLKDDGNWWTYAKGFAIFFPYIWPIHSKHLQFRAVLVGFCLLGSNSLNVLVPRQLGAVTDALVSGDVRRSWVEVAVYAALTFANSGACVGWLQFWLWQPIQQYSYDALNTAAHSHVMNLSSDFHESKEASEIHQAVFQGRSIISLVDTVCFQVVPMFVDLILVFAYLYYLFGPYMALNLAITTLFYLYTTTKLVSMAAVRRRAYVTYYRKEWRSAYSSINNWRVASYFNRIPFEENRYACNVKDHLKSEKGYKLSIRFVSAAQGLIITLGLLGGCFLAVYQVMHHIRSPGDFVILLSYWAQLRGPLSFFSNMYKDVSESMMDAERLLELFQTKPTIVDRKDAKPLSLVKGKVNFHEVNFAYDTRKTTIKEVTFTIPGGSTVALVGETGSGKSTLLKLLNRFYDLTGGSIEIDGQDISKVTLRSLRDKIGVVPQDPTLFNDSIMNNVRYARLTASDQEVYEACKSAAIHDKIMSFPDGYNSKVGNRGIKLSGGEQQRIAIARAILKQPEIILLDEATSSVDTETEQLIQEAFRTLCHGRTTIIVAHRLSTIMRADRIMVVKNGEIIEDGSHDELICLNGKYRDLWSKQILVEPAKVPEGSCSRSGSPHKRDANIVNDLDPKGKKIELAKLLRSTDQADVGNHNAEAECHTTPVDSQRFKAPKLKPDAPAFVPRHLRADTEGTNDSAKVETKQELKDRLKKEKEQKRKEKEDRKAYLSIAKAAKKASKRPEVSEYAAESIGEASQSTHAPEKCPDSATSGTDTKDEEPMIRRPRLRSLRNQSKSEPASHMQDSMDGIQDCDDLNEVSSGEGQPFLGAGQTQQRRASAPTDPSSGQQDIRRTSYSGRARRTRRWRDKNHAAKRSGSATTSGPTSSQDTFTDAAAPPNTPVTSPAGGFQPAGVKFASGT